MIISTMVEDIIMLVRNKITWWLCFFILFVWGGFYSQEKVSLDKVLLKDGSEEYGIIIKKSIAGIELKKDKESIKIDYGKIQNHLFGESKSEFELVFDSLLTGNFVKASSQLSELETKIKRSVIKEDIKFYLALSYYYQKNHDKFFETIESLIKEYPDSYYLYNILSFIVDLNDVTQISELSGGVSRIVSQIATNLAKVKEKKDSLIENIGKLAGGIVKENSGNYTEAQDIYQDIAAKYPVPHILGSVAEIFMTKNLIRNNNLNTAIKKLEKLKDELIKQGDILFTKNILSLLGDIYRKQSEDAKEDKEKLLKKALYSYMNIYLLYIPAITDLPEVYAKSMYYIYYILSELSRSEKDENKKNEYLTKAQAIKAELKQKYANSSWAEKVE